MKTIFIILDTGTAIRNILRTDIFKVLKEQNNLKIVIFSPIVDEEFKNEVGADNVFIEHVQKWKPNPIVKAIRSFKKDLWAEKKNVFTFSTKRKRKEGRFLRGTVIELFKKMGLYNKSDSLIKSFDSLESYFVPALADSFFKRYKPALVFYTTLYSKDPCIEIAAKQRNIRTICFIQSWDNPTSKGPFQVIPDRIIIWNNILKDELIRYHDFPSENIFVSGVPQFDLYTEKQNFSSKTNFFKKWNLAPERNLLTYTTGTPGTAPFDHEVVELLYNALQKNSFIYPCQLLVRLHPKDKYEYYKRFENKPYLVLQMPGRPAQTNDGWNPTREDTYGLAELMRYSDVVINVASTITIDAAVFDTPVVNVAFDGYKSKNYKDSCKRYYDYEHYKNIVKSGGVKIAYSLEELIHYINLYLGNPAIDAEGRRRIREEQCWKLDGNSGRRIAEYILHNLHSD